MRYMHTCTVSALLCCRGVIYGTEGVARALRTLRLGVLEEQVWVARGWDGRNRDVGFGETERRV